MYRAGTFPAFSWWFAVLVTACRRDKSGMSGLWSYMELQWEDGLLEVVINTQESNLLAMANSITVHATQLHLFAQVMKIP